MTENQLIAPPNLVTAPLESTVNLRELIRFYSMALQRGWRIIAIAVAVTLTLASIYLATTRRMYEAKSRLLVLQQGGRPINVAHNDLAQSQDHNDDYIPTHALIVSSPLVVRRAIESVGLQKLPTLAHAQAHGLDPVDLAIERLHVERPDRFAKILYVTYRAWSRDEAIRTVKAVLESYQKFLEESFESKSNEAIHLIAKARDELSRELDELQRKYREFRQSNKTLLADEHGRSFASIQLEQLYRASNEARIKAVALKAQLEMGSQLSNNGAGLWAIAHAMQQVSGDGGVGASTLVANTAGMSQGASLDYLRQLGEEQQKLAERFGPNNARVQEIKQQIERAQREARDVRKRMEKGETGDLIASIQSSLKAIESMQTELKSQFEHGLQEAKEIENDLLVDANLRDSMERQRALFNSVVEQLKQAQFVSDYSSISAQVIEPPNALKRAVSPRMNLTLAIALLIGGALGIAAAVAAEHLDQRIRTFEETRELLKMPMLGLIPEIPQEMVAMVRHCGLLAGDLPQSVWSESYRSLRTNIDFLRRSQPAQVIMVTSPCSGDGKTTTSSNLATIIAHAGKKVLLIDADLRKPSQDKIHNLKLDQGLSQVLLGVKSFASVIQPSSSANLDILTAGPIPTSPAELLASSRFAEFLEELRTLYDVVIIDTPPILAVTDASIISAAVDGILLVINAKKTRRFDAQHAVDAVNALGTAVFGVVINGTSSEWFGGGYGSYGRYDGYGYGNGYGNGYGSHGLAARHRGGPAPEDGAQVDPRLGLTPAASEHRRDGVTPTNSHNGNGQVL